MHDDCSMKPGLAPGGAPECRCDYIVTITALRLRPSPDSPRARARRKATKRAPIWKRRRAGERRPTRGSTRRRSLDSCRWHSGGKTGQQDRTCLENSVDTGEVSGVRALFPPLLEAESREARARPLPGACPMRAWCASHPASAVVWRRVVQRTSGSEADIGWLHVSVKHGLSWRWGFNSLPTHEKKIDPDLPFESP